MYHIICSIAYLIDPVIFIYACYNLLIPKYTNKIFYVIASLYFYIIVLIKQYMLLKDVTTSLVFFIFPFIVLSMYYCCNLFFYGKQKTKLFIVISVLTLSALVDGIFYIVFFISGLSFEKVISETVRSTMLIFSARICNLFLSLVFFKIVSCYTYRKITMKIYMKIIFLYNFVLIFYLGMAVFYNDQYSPYVSNFFYGILVCFITLFSLFIIIAYSERHKKEEETLNKEMLIEQQLLLLNRASEITDELRSLRHDMHAHLYIVKDLVAEKKYDQLNHYMDELCINIDCSKAICLYNNNYILSVLVSQKMEEAQKKNIDFQHIILAESIPLTDFQQNILFSNILNNAFEAVQTVPDKISRMVYLKISRKSNSEILISCENTFTKKPVVDHHNHLLTLKSEPKNHGLGIHNIKKIVKKNGGTVNFGYNNNHFNLIVILKEKH